MYFSNSIYNLCNYGYIKHNLIKYFSQKDIMYWATPPKIKIMEALGTIADKRITFNDNTAEVRSSDGTRKYNVNYVEPDTIDSTDNGSYYKGYMGYPSIAFLMLKGKLKFDDAIAEAMKGIPWAEWNDINKSYWKTERQVKEVATERGVSIEEIDDICEEVSKQITNLKMKKPENIENK